MMGEEVKTIVRQYVVRAKLEVEVEGDAVHVVAVLDGVLASVRRHFPQDEAAEPMEPDSFARPGAEPGAEPASVRVNGVQVPIK